MSGLLTGIGGISLALAVFAEQRKQGVTGNNREFSQKRSGGRRKFNVINV